MSKSRVICNTSPVIGLLRINRLDLLWELLIDTLGIMGILLEAKRRGLINELKPEVDALRKTGYRISQTLYDMVLQRAGEL